MSRFPSSALYVQRDKSHFKGRRLARARGMRRQFLIGIRRAIRLLSIVRLCEFVCLLQPDRCDCGVQEFTATEVICKECSACGDGRCSDGETPESCPRDCATMCTPGRLRCAGENREECSLQGVWQSLPCPVGEQCRESGGDVTCGRICVVGETRCDDGKRQQCSSGHLGDECVRRR